MDDAVLKALFQLAMRGKKIDQDEETQFLFFYRGEDDT